LNGARQRRDLAPSASSNAGPAVSTIQEARRGRERPTGPRRASGRRRPAKCCRRLDYVLSGVTVVDATIGDGPLAARGCRVTVRYTGYLNRGEVFQRDVVLSFIVGERNIIAGLSHGVEGMRVGGRRRVRVGPQVAYRDRGVPGVVPPNAKLTFDVELLSVE
jgi:FKBP-type peptidyl-prolyl cis-trans isomerase